jgi:lipopolysaccharide transport system permease protein
VTSGSERLRDAWNDLAAIGRTRELWWALALQDLRQRYRRSVLGPFWITLSMAVLVFAIGPLYSLLFKVPAAEFIPHFALGLWLWNLLSTLLSEGCQAFIQSDALIRSTPLPYAVHAMRVLMRNLLVFAHNAIAIVALLLVFGIAPSIGWFWLLPGLLLIAAAALPAILLLAMACARFRDLPQIVASVLQVLFFVTPVIWQPQLLGERQYLADGNPLHWFIELLRAPILGQAQPAWQPIACLSVALLLSGLALLVFAAYRRRIAFWV